jgi:hypothetical protein
VREKREKINALGKERAFKEKVLIMSNNFKNHKQLIIPNGRINMAFYVIIPIILPTTKVVT